MRRRGTTPAAVLAALVALVALGAAETARADTPPSGWQIAKDPKVRSAWETHLDYERNIAADEVVKGLGKIPVVDGNLYVERARGVLEDADARHSSDPRLVFDLGLCYERLGRHLDAVDVLGDALARWPDHPAAEEGWLHYAFANAHLERPAEERRAYERYLAIATEASRRLVPTLNMAEADMRAGDLAAAVDGYRAVLRDAAGLPNLPWNAQTSKLATWGLAVALDRQGDLFGAARVAKQATAMDPPPPRTRSYALTAPLNDTAIMDATSVFFVPAYERMWYLALGETELAKAETDPRRALEHWRHTEKLWGLYIAGARGAKTPDRWLAMAERRIELVKRRRAEVEARVTKLPPLPSVRVFID